MKSRLLDRSSRSQKLLERQVRSWQMSDKTTRPGRRIRRRHLRDFVTISRQPGTGGEAIARAAGRQLEWRVLDREILEAMADNEDQREHLYATVDERQHSWMDGLLVLVAPEILSRRDDYLHALARVVVKAASTQSCVFVGRGVNFILPRDKGLRVLIVAPFEYRVERWRQARGMTARQARRKVARADKERAAFTDSLFHGDSDDPTQYDLTLNIANMTRVRARAVIVAAARPREKP